MRTSFFSLFLILLFFTTVTVKAQIEVIDVEPVKEKASFQLRGGLNISNVTGSGKGYNLNGDAKIGFNVAGIVDIPLNKTFYLQTGLMFTSKGTNVDGISSDIGLLDASMTAMYVQLPLYFVYKAELPNSTNKLNVALGPYFAYGVAGKTSYEQGGFSASLSDNTFQDGGMWNRPDIGFGAEIQFEMEKVVFILGSEFGITKVWKREYLLDNIHVRNQNVYLSVGFRF